MAGDVLPRREAQTENVEILEACRGLPVKRLVEPRPRTMVGILAFREGRRVGEVEVGDGDGIAARHDLAKFAREVEPTAHVFFEKRIRAHHRSAVVDVVVAAAPDRGNGVHTRDVERVPGSLHQIAVAPHLRDVNARRRAPGVRAQHDRRLRGVDLADDRDILPEDAREEVRHLLGGELHRTGRLWRDRHLRVLRRELQRRRLVC